MRGIEEVARKFVLLWLRAYKWAISPFFLPACRYVPTCSEYAMESIDRHGLVRGTVVAMWRVLRCNPFAKGGYDPVPSPAGTKKSIGPSRRVAVGRH